ncbi:MAG: B12-binding domain-containing radical SAM protein [Proteobacteria bacterium]|nr:B12-binding domain-containing radical SAM protein [Pseudomonadota bacterium]
MNTDKSNKKIMLIYPPGKAYQRGEDRCQGNIENSAATSIHACNDLGYVASGLHGLPYRIFLKDYPVEKGRVSDLISDFKTFFPDLVFMSITQATIFHDLDTIARLKTLHSGLVVVLKGALFFDPVDTGLSRLDLSCVDYLIGGESDFVGARLIHCHFNNKSPHHLGGILYKHQGAWIKTDFSRFEDNLDCLRFPDRSLMNNQRYTRPDTGRAQATISVARGCPSSCIYCLTPIISGKKLRQRSPENVMAELRECYHRFKIHDFFLKSDTFTLDASWVKRLCHLIMGSELCGHIAWVANSRTRPLEYETLALMKQAGCWLVAFGFESGSPESLIKMGKGATVDDSLRAAGLARKAGLKIFGFFMAGFPWENMDHLKATEDLIYGINADFIEIHIPIPHAKTPLNHLCTVTGQYSVDDLGHDYFASPATGTLHLSKGQIQDFRKRVLFDYYFRVSYILNRLKDTIKNPKALIYYGHYALRLFVNLVRVRP